jgi:ribonucleotide reductase class II
MFKNAAAEFVYYRTYARWIDDLNRRETWEETIDRVIEFLKSERGDKVPAKVFDKIKHGMLSFDIMPSMRLVWSAGDAAKKDNTTLYNCSFIPVDSIESFAECLHILCCGTGVGFSVEKKHIEKLPVVKPVDMTWLPPTITIADSREGWADSVKVLLQHLFDGKDVVFDYSKIRSKGSRLKTMGGRASGPEPLILLHAFMKDAVSKAQGRQLTPLECHDIMNKIAEIVVVGGVRRSSQISLSDLNDEEMRHAKEWPFPLHRAMANNSAVYYEKPSAVEFLKEWAALAASGTGERGISNLGAARSGAPKRRKGELIEGFNPCKPLSATILTPNGYISFEDAMKLDKLKVVGPDNKIYDATKPFITGYKKEVMRILLSNGRWLYGTPNHKHMTPDGQWKTLDQYAIGDRVMTKIHAVHNNVIANVERYNMGVLCGWIWGDGFLTKRNDSKNALRLGLCFGDKELDVADFITKTFNLKLRDHGQKPKTCKVAYGDTELSLRVLNEGASLFINEDGNISLDKENIKWLRNKDKDFKLGFLRAIFTADGSSRHNGRVQLYSTLMPVIDQCAETLNEFGVYTSVGRRGIKCVKNGSYGFRNQAENYRLDVSFSQFETIGFLSAIKNQVMSTRNKHNSIRKDLTLNTSYIKKIERNYSTEDVYDITVHSKDHAFLDTTVVTSNCHEIALRSLEFCNLSSIIVRPDDDLVDLMEKVETATWIGVIQSTFTDFPYLRKKWSENCEEERLLGVSLSGQMDNTELLTADAMKALKAKAIKVAQKAAKALEINCPVSITCVKPEGTSSQVVYSGSGLHPWYSEYFIRRYRIAAHDPLRMMLKAQGVEMTPENGQTAETANTWVVSFPMKAPEGAVVKDTLTALDQLEWYKRVQDNWVEHNASATIYVKDHEWLEVGNWVYKNWDTINGLSFMPADGGRYEQAPLEAISKEKYEEMLEAFPKIDYSQLGFYELEDSTEGAKTYACTSGSCEI